MAQVEDRTMMLDRNPLINRWGAGAQTMSLPHLCFRNPPTLAFRTDSAGPTQYWEELAPWPASTSLRRLMQIVRLGVLALAAVTLATPASAQFGGLKKKIQKATGGETAAPAADPTPATGGSVVLTPDVVNKLITGLKAGEVERQAAAQSDDNSYGRYQRAQRAYADAQAKCEANRQAWAMKGNTK